MPELPININDLLHQRTVKGERVEYKAGWNPGIRIEALNGDRIVARRYRNRRVGDFLKELDLTEDRCTGIPTMRTAMSENGSPPPRFTTDDNRTYFFVELLVHPGLPGIGRTNEQAHDGTHDELTGNAVSILKFLAGGPRQRVEIADFLGIKRRSGSNSRALEALLSSGLVELTLPDKTTSRNQRYRITAKGHDFLAKL